MVKRNKMNTIKKLILKLNEIIKFSAVGIINTAVDFAVFTLFLKAFNVQYLVCQVLGYSSGAINSFLMNKTWTFKANRKDKKAYSEIVQFFVINLISLAASTYSMKLLSGNLHLNVYIAKVIVIFITQAINFIGYKFWVFK